MKLTPIERDGLAQQLITARQGARVTKAEVARKAGLSRMTVGQMETGYRSMSPRALKAYAVLCRLDVDTLLLAWGFCPDDVIARLKEKPSLCALVRQS